MPKRKLKVNNEQRFEDISNETLQEKQVLGTEIQEGVRNRNTIKSDEKCERILVNYIATRHKDLDLNYWEWDPKHSYILHLFFNLHVKVIFN